MSMWYGKNDGKWDDDLEIAPKQLTATEVAKEFDRQQNIQRLKELLEELFNDKRY